VKRILMVLSVALVMVAVVALMAAPAFAGGARCKGHSPHGVCHHGGPP